MTAPYLGALEQIRQEDGTLRPDRVVERASDPRSPLHSYFQWDDTAAAREHRLSQARQLIRAVVTIIDSPGRDPIKVRAFISLPSDRTAGQGYRSVADVMGKAELAAEAMASLQEDISRLRLKYRYYSELAEVLDALDRAVETRPVRRRRQHQAQAAA